MKQLTSSKGPEIKNLHSMPERKTTSSVSTSRTSATPQNPRTNPERQKERDAAFIGFKKSGQKKISKCCAELSLWLENIPLNNADKENKLIETLYLYCRPE